MKATIGRTHEAPEAALAVRSGPPLQGEESLDPVLLDRAVAEINRIYASKGLETARTIGNYVVETFFGGELDAFHQREKRHTTFRALAEREDLHVAYNTIWYSVAVLEQLRLLPESIAEALPLTHHKLLLPVNDASAKVDLARRAIEEGLSSRDFAQVVKKACMVKKGETRGGRPPLPAFAKAITRLQQVVELATSEEVSADSFVHYSTDVARELVANMDQQIARLVELKAKVLAAAQARDGSIPEAS